MKIIHLGLFETSLLSNQLKELEKLMTYPLGTDSFQIDHGEDYFSFFRRMGEVQCYGVMDEDRLVAVGMGILRSVSFNEGEKPHNAWYLCDLKVAPTHRGQHLPLCILRKAFLRSYVRCARGYAVSMNPLRGENRIVRLLARFPWAPTQLATTLNIFSWDHDAMIQIAPLIEKHRGAISYLSLNGIKDLILKSTEKPLPLLHVQHGSRISKGSEKNMPLKDFTHMFCCPVNDILSKELNERGLKPAATASVIHHRMKKSDWRFILTSDI